MRYPSWCLQTCTLAVAQEDTSQVFHNSLPHLSWEQTKVMDWFVVYILLIKRAPKLEKMPQKLKKCPKKYVWYFTTASPTCLESWKKLSSEFVCCEWGKVASDAMSISCEQKDKGSVEKGLPSPSLSKYHFLLKIPFLQNL